MTEAPGDQIRPQTAGSVYNRPQTALNDVSQDVEETDNKFCFLPGMEHLDSTEEFVYGFGGCVGDLGFLQHRTRNTESPQTLLAPRPQRLSNIATIPSKPESREIRKTKP